MKKIDIILIGKTKYEGVDFICENFKQRIKSFYRLEEYILKEGKSDFIEKEILNKIFNLLNIKNKDIILKEKINCKKISNIIVFSPEGIEMDSNQFSNIIFDNILINYDNVIFIVGNKEGIPNSIKNIAGNVISFSKMVFGHQIFKIILYEQIYRAICIKNKINYAF